MSALHRRTATMLLPPTASTDLSFNFILNHCHDRIHHHCSLSVSGEIMNKKIIHTWQEKAINPLSCKMTYLPTFSLLHTGQTCYTATTAKIFQKHSSSSYHRFLCLSSSLFMLLVLKSFCLSLFRPPFFKNKVLLNSTVKFLFGLQ